MSSFASLKTKKCGSAKKSRRRLNTLGSGQIPIPLNRVKALVFSGSGHIFYILALKFETRHLIKYKQEDNKYEQNC